MSFSTSILRYRIDFFPREKVTTIVHKPTTSSTCLFIKCARYLVLMFGLLSLVASCFVNNKVVYEPSIKKKELITIFKPDSSPSLTSKDDWKRSQAQERIWTNSTTYMNFYSRFTPEITENHVFTAFLTHLEKISLEAASLLEIGSVVSQRTTHIVLNLQNLHLSSQSKVYTKRLEKNALFVYSLLSNQIMFPRQSMERVAYSEQRTSLSMAFTCLPYPAILVSLVGAKDCSDAYETERTGKKTVLGSDIIIISVSSKHHTPLTENVSILFQHKLVGGEGMLAYQCVYWDTALHGWLGHGCRAVQSNLTHTVCQCQHLSSFALIVNMAMTTNNALSLPQTLLTYIFLPISILGLSLCIATFASFKNLKSRRNSVHLHMFSSLLASQLLFAVGIWLTQIDALCQFIAISMHYTFLCTFSWMLIEGLYVYRMLVQPFQCTESPMTSKNHYSLCGFAYGLPLLIVVISLAARFNEYQADLYCWLSTRNGLIWSFVGPALVVIIFNSFILALSIYVMCTHSRKSQAMQNRNFRARLSVWMKGVVMLLVILGIPYFFGILHLDKYSAFLSYLFIYLNACQGGFIFTFHCLMNEKIIKEYIRFIGTFLERYNLSLPFGLKQQFYAFSLHDNEEQRKADILDHLMTGWEPPSITQRLATYFGADGKKKKMSTAVRKETQVSLFENVLDYIEPIVKQEKTWLQSVFRDSLDSRDFIFEDHPELVVHKPKSTQISTTLTRSQTEINQKTTMDPGSSSSTSETLVVAVDSTPQTLTAPTYSPLLGLLIKKKISIRKKSSRESVKSHDKDQSDYTPESQKSVQDSHGEDSQVPDTSSLFTNSTMSFSSSSENFKGSSPEPPDLSRRGGSQNLFDFLSVKRSRVSLPVQEEAKSIVPIQEEVIVSPPNSDIVPLLPGRESISAPSDSPSLQVSSLPGITSTPSGSQISQRLPEGDMITSQAAELPQTQATDKSGKYPVTNKKLSKFGEWIKRGSVKLPFQVISGRPSRSDEPSGSICDSESSSASTGFLLQGKGKADSKVKGKGSKRKSKQYDVSICEEQDEPTQSALQSIFNTTGEASDKQPELSQDMDFTNTQSLSSDFMETFLRKTSGIHGFKIRQFFGDDMDGFSILAKNLETLWKDTEQRRSGSQIGNTTNMITQILSKDGSAKVKACTERRLTDMNSATPETRSVNSLNSTQRNDDDDLTDMNSATPETRSVNSLNSTQRNDDDDLTDMNSDTPETRSVNSLNSTQRNDDDDLTDMNSDTPETRTLNSRAQRNEDDDSRLGNTGKVPEVNNLSLMQNTMDLKRQSLNKDVRSKISPESGLSDVDGNNVDGGADSSAGRALDS